MASVRPTASDRPPVSDVGSPSTAASEPVPEERTIYVTDDGLLDTGEFDQLNAEFRHKLGLLSDEDAELSEVFKVRIGLASTDRDQFDRLADEIDLAMAGTDGARRDETIRKNRITNYATKYFQPGSPPMQFTKDRLKRPLLAKNNNSERRASLAVWLAIQRFMNGSTTRRPSSSTKALETPIISRVWDMLESQRQPLGRTASSPASSSSSSSSSSAAAPASKTVRYGSTSKRLSIKKLFKGRQKHPDDVESSSSSSDGVSESVPDDAASNVDESPAAVDDDDDSRLLTDDVVDGIPTTELDLVNYIVAHGILKKELRDEIFCQLCCLVTKNPSPESRKRGWMLHALCAGCFLPSMQFLSYYYGFLYDIASTDTLRYANYTRRTLRRTNKNGMRFHPPSSVELAAVKDQKSMGLDVSLPDRRLVSVDVDSASTSSEICEMIAEKIGLKDQFGFSLYISINGKESSLGSGLDHVMDAITECEQLTRSQGRLESTAKWRLFYRKELFTPWYSPTVDQVATELIYRQIIEGVHSNEYRLHPEDIYTYVARCLYIEHGRHLQADVAKNKMADYFPKAFIATNNNNKSRENLVKTVMASFDSQGFSGYAVPAKFIQHEIVASASSVWPTHFSAMFEAIRCEGPPLPRNDVILAVNSGGVFLLDTMNYDVIVGFHYYDVVDAIAENSSEVRHACVRLIAIDGAEFKFLCPNSETVARIITAFLEGLRRRSRWAVTIESIIIPDQTSSLRLKPGDVIELLDVTSDDVINKPSTSSPAGDDDVDLLYGRSERTGDRGSFPRSCIYVLPTIDKPSPEFLSLISSLSKASMDTLPRQRHRGTMIIQTGEDEHGTESSA